MLTRDRLQELLTYQPETGKFFWRVSRGRNVRPGDEAGGRISIGYLNVPIDGKRYYLHRLAVLYITGEHPAGQVDHVNGDRGDNRWNNLRQCAAQQQQWNMQKRKDGSSRFKGVMWSEFHGRWRTYIRVSGRVVCGSVHLDEESAARQYDYMARKYFGEFACVNFPETGEQGARERQRYLSPQAGES